MDLTIVKDEPIDQATALKFVDRFHHILKNESKNTILGASSEGASFSATKQMVLPAINCITKSLEQCQNLALPPSDCFRKMELSTVISLNPVFLPGSDTSSLKLGFSRHVEKQRLLQPNAQIKGTMITYHVTRYGASKCEINDEYPFLPVPYEFWSVVFQPRHGDYLIGKVVQINGDHLGLVVYDVFNASIVSSRCSGLVHGTDQWRNDDMDITIGSLVRFQVVDAADGRGHGLTICGCMEDLTETGCMAYLEEKAGVPQTQRISKRSVSRSASRSKSKHSASRSKSKRSTSRSKSKKGQKKSKREKSEEKSIKKRKVSETNDEEAE